MQGPQCQFENREGAKFCKKCGNKLELLCPACGHPYQVDSIFCDECGYNFSPRKEASNEISETESLPYSPSTDIPFNDVDPITGERKHVTVLFSDLAGYTAMSEKLDPEEVKEITSRIFGEISKIVGKFDGFIEKYVGDAVMAIFGVPKAHEDDPIRAVKVAREIHGLVDAISPEVQDRIGQPISMHTGINTGLVVTGEVDMDRGTHGIAGDTINLASRLSNMAKPGEILIDADTCLQAEGHFVCEYLEDTTVKGKADPVQVHKVLSQREKPVTIRRLSGVRAKLIGRKVEIVELAEAVEDLHRGKGRIFSISGDAGTGKSRLVEEFKATLDLREIQWLEGHAYAYTQNIPYFLLIDLLNRVFDIKEDDPVKSVRKKIESGIEHLVDNHKDVIPYVGGLYSLSYPEVEEVSPEFWKSRLQEAIPAILTALAKRAPTVFFLEDLHWADPSFVELLRRSCLEIRQPAIVLCVYRPIFSLFKSHQVSSIGKLYHEMRLQDLSRSESQEMVQSLLKTEKVPSELQRFIQEKIEGNPFYLEEAINSLIESNTLVRDNGHWRVTKHISEADISSTIQGVITARVDRLEQESKKILQEASVIGRSFYYEILKRTTALKDSIDENLSGLEHLDLIKTKSIQPDLEYIFKHALTQEVVYNGLLKKERREIHERIAIVMEQLFQDRLPEFYETLAFHFARGLSLNKASNYLMKSGKKSLARYSIEESHQYYKEAFNLLADKPNLWEDDKELLIDILIKWAYVFYYQGDFKSFVDLYRQNEHIAKSLSDKTKRGFFLAWFGMALWERENFKKSESNLRKALEIGKTAGDQMLIGYASCWLSLTCSDLGLLDEALSLATKAHEIAKLLDSDHYLFFKSLNAKSEAYYYMGYFTENQEIGKLLLDYGNKHSNIRCLVLGYFSMAFSYSVAGNFSLAIESCKQAVKVAEDPFYSMFPKPLMAFNYLQMGEFKEAEKIGNEVLSFSKKYGCEFQGTLSSAILDLVMIANGKMATGLKQLKDILQRIKETEHKGFLPTGEYILGKIYFQISTGEGPISLSTIIKNAGFLLKTIPVASTRAEFHFNKAIETASEIGAKGVLAQAYLDLGLLHKAKKRKDQAKKCISDAVQLFEQCKADVYLKQANEALESLR